MTWLYKLCLTIRDAIRRWIESWDSTKPRTKGTQMSTLQLLMQLAGLLKTLSSDETVKQIIALVKQIMDSRKKQSNLVGAASPEEEAAAVVCLCECGLSEADAASAVESCR